MLKEKRYEIKGIKEGAIRNLKDGDLRDDVMIFTHSTSDVNKKDVEVLINLNFIDMLKTKFDVLMYNLKHKNAKLELVKVGAKH